MACGCASGTCNCVIQGGTGVTVSGTGPPGDPYVISATGSTVTVTDTNSVDLTLTGQNIKADVIRDPEATNLLVIGPAGLDVPCEAVQDCIGAALDDGLVYDDAGNQIRVRVSTDPGNTMVFGGDNGLYTPGSPVTLGCGLEFGGLGEIQANVQAFGTLTRRNCDDDSDEPGTTPLPGPDTAGMPVYCGADGNLRTMPEKFTDVQTTGANEAHVPALTVFPASSSIISLTVTNPSSQYCICGYATFAIITTLSGAPGTVLRVLQDKDLGDGAGFSLTTGWTADQRGKSANAGAPTMRNALPIPICLDPGETKILRHRVTYQRDPANDNGGAVSVTASAHEIYWVGTNI